MSNTASSEFDSLRLFAATHLPADEDAPPFPNPAMSLYPFVPHVVTRRGLRMSYLDEGRGETVVNAARQPDVELLLPQSGDDAARIVPLHCCPITSVARALRESHH